LSYDASGGIFLKALQKNPTLKLVKADHGVFGPTIVEQFKKLGVEVKSPIDLDDEAHDQNHIEEWGENGWGPKPMAENQKPFDKAMKQLKQSQP